MNFIGCGRHGFRVVGKKKSEKRVDRLNLKKYRFENYKRRRKLQTLQLIGKAAYARKGH